MPLLPQVNYAKRNAITFFNAILNASHGKDIEDHVFVRRAPSLLGTTQVLLLDHHNHLAAGVVEEEGNLTLLVLLSILTILRNRVYLVEAAEAAAEVLLEAILVVATTKGATFMTMAEIGTSPHLGVLMTLMEDPVGMDLTSVIGRVPGMDAAAGVQ